MNRFNISIQLEKDLISFELLNKRVLYISSNYKTPIYEISLNRTEIKHFWDLYLKDKSEFLESVKEFLKNFASFKFNYDLNKMILQNE